MTVSSTVDRGLEHTEVGALCGIGLSSFSVPDSMPESVGESCFRWYRRQDIGRTITW